MRKKILGKIVLVFLAAVASFTTVMSNAYAENTYVGPMVGFMMSPMTNRVTLEPGGVYTGSFWIMNPEENTTSVKYNLDIRSFYRDNDNKAIFEDIDGRGQLAKWITIDVPDNNIIAPKESDEIRYTIRVPQNAPAGGQYAAIAATSMPMDEDKDGAVSLSESIAMTYTIFAEVSGQTIKKSEITDLNSPGFIIDGNIVASSKVANVGNVHGTATYTLEVYPLFSDQPIYSNASDPEKKLVLPGRTMVHESVFGNTPAAGFFNILYKVEFENGEVKELKKLVIKCPLWVLLVIASVVVGLIMYFVIKAKKRSRQRQKDPSF